MQAATRLEGMFDFIQVFALDQATLDRDIGGAHAALEPGGLLWVSYPKGSSKLPTDLSRDEPALLVSALGSVGQVPYGLGLSR